MASRGRSSRRPATTERASASRRSERAAKRTGWSVDDVQRYVADVRCVGVGGFLPLLADETWIGANVNLLKELGPEEYLRRMLDNLRTNFAPDAADPPWIEQKPEAEVETPLEASFMAVGGCEGCGGGIVVLLDEHEQIFAQAHFPTEPDWLEGDFIPALRNAAKTPPHTKH